MSLLRSKIQSLYRDFGTQKPMGQTAPAPERPHYYLHRNFLGEQDLLIILNTKRCSYQCHFCQLPAKSSRSAIADEAVVSQVEYVVTELKNSLSLIQRVTISNEGSVLDVETLSANALVSILEGVSALRRVNRVVLESRLEYATREYLSLLSCSIGKAKLDILTGFETLDENIRNEILGKKEPLCVFETGLDALATCGADLTAYVLFKPSPIMSDQEALVEAQASIDYLIGHASSRKLRLTIRLNPMYGALGSLWFKRASMCSSYRPPRLSDVMRVAQETRSRGIPTYIGLSTEGLATDGFDYRSREDYSLRLLFQAREFNELERDIFDFHGKD